MFREVKGKRWVGILLSKCNGCALIHCRQRSIELMSHEGFLFQTFAVSLSNTYSFPFKPL